MKEVEMKFIERIVERMANRTSGPETIKTLLVATSMVSFGLGGLFEKLSYNLDRPYLSLGVLVLLGGTWMCCLGFKKQNPFKEKE